MASSGDFKATFFNPPKYIVDVVSEKSNIVNFEDKRQRWTISDVAVRSGIDINTAKKDLLNLAYITEATLEVTDDGEIFFSFPPNWKTVLFQRSFARRVKLKYDEYSPILSAGFRATFGIILISSIIFIAIVLSSASSSSSEENNNKQAQSNGNIGLRLNLFDMMESSDRPNKDSSSMSFLDSCYSYLFGDVDPNEELASRQDIKICSIIRSNNGVVIAEQLAPYISQPPVCKMNEGEYGANTEVDESWVLPVVIKFDGKPVVTSDGHIVYQFENLLKTASSEEDSSNDKGLRGVYMSVLQNLFKTTSSDGGGSKGLEAVTSLDENEFMEKKKKFSAAEPNMLFMAAGLGVLNLGGAVALGSLSMNALSFSTAVLVKRFYPAVLAYGILYNAIPLVRSFVVKAENNDIEKRNNERRKWISFARNPSEELQQKVAAMNDLKLKPQRIDESKIIYSTDENK